MRAIVVIPTYNEQDNLEELINRIFELVPGLHVLVVDDNSPDGTGKLANEFSRKNPDKFFVIHRAKKEGLRWAYLEGFRYVLQKGYEVIVQMDADLSHDPVVLPVFIEQIRSNDLVVGSRYLDGGKVVNWSRSRLLISRLGTRYVRFMTGIPFTDVTSGFKCWKQGALRAICAKELFSNGYLFQIEMLYKAYRMGCKIQEVPIVFYERKKGYSKFNLKIIQEALWGVFKLRSIGSR